MTNFGIGALVIKKARLGSLEVDELTVRRLRVVEPVSSLETGPPELPKTGAGIA
jgi:hypothetical protein